MSKKYIDKILNDVFKSSDNTARRQLSESGNTHHAILTRDFMENAYGRGLLEHDIEFTLEDLRELSDKFQEGITKGIGNKTNVTWEETKLGGGGIILTVEPRETKSKKGKSETALKDIKYIVKKGKKYARPTLDELVKAGGGTTKGYTFKGTGKNKKRILNTSGKIEKGLSYAHGEGGGPISTLGTETGLEVLKKINPKDLEKELDESIMDGNIFMRVVQTHMVDYYQNTLKWDIVRVNPKNNALIIEDDLNITGAFKFQEPDFAKKYDLPGRGPDGKFEKRYKDTLRTELVKALNAAVKQGGLKADQLSGSPTPVKRAQVISVKTIVNELEKQLKKADKRGVVTITTALEKIKDSKARDKSKIKIKKAKGRIRGVTTGATKKPRRKTSAVANSHVDASPIALKSLLQKVLPAEIAKKMTGPPTLMYQTGRFAQSAEITDIAPFKKSVEIRYDYMQDPYRVFERGSGSPLASVGRDPRGLIGGTIRELAQQLMGNKFLVRTKRV